MTPVQISPYIEINADEPEKKPGTCHISPAAIAIIQATGITLALLGVGSFLFAATFKETFLPLLLIITGVATYIFGDILQEPTTLAPLSIESPFSVIDSSKTIEVQASNRLKIRADFLEANLPNPPLFIGKSPFVSTEMVEHLMRNKKDLALGIKYAPGDKITNMEGALHTFIAPVGPILMSGDFRWEGVTVGKAFEANVVRPMILSATIQPDFELETVIIPIVKMGEVAVEGVPLSDEEMNHLLHTVDRSNPEERAAYDEQLRKHMIYHLTQDHRLPASSEMHTRNSRNPEYAQAFLSVSVEFDQAKYIRDVVKDIFVRVRGSKSESAVSMEVLLNLFIQQLRSELKVLNQNLSQGYVYTISPPAIFTTYIGGDAFLLNRLQAFAFKYLVGMEPELFTNLQRLAFNDYQDKQMIDLYKTVFQNTDVQVMAFKDLYDESGYVGPEGLALVLHNNSDAFGQNIEFEGASSMDGLIGSVSNAACLLRRDRPDLVDNVL